MWRATIAALILMTGCASGGHKTTEAEKPGFVERREVVEPHEHSGHHDSDDVGSSILGGFFQILLDVVFGGDGC